MNNPAQINKIERFFAFNQQEPRNKTWFFFYVSWEQRKLSSLTTLHARIGWQNLRTSEFLDSGDYMLITGTDFNDGAINYNTCHFVEKERYEQDRNIQIHNGSILITKDGTLGKVAYVQGLSMPATLNAGVFNVQIKDKQMVDETYLFQYLKAPFLMKYVDQKATGGTIKHLNQNILADFPVVMPTMAEQSKIGRVFQALDNLITLHQRKEKTEFIGEKTEKRGFKITFSWEQRKFSELYVKVSEKNDLTYSKDEIISVANMYYKPDSFITDPEYLRTYNVFHLGDIAFEGNKSKNFAHGRFVENTIGDGIVSHVFDVFRPKMNYDLLFWKYAINNERIMGSILVRCTKASTMMTNLVANDFLQETILVPS